MTTICALDDIKCHISQQPMTISRQVN